MCVGSALCVAGVDGSRRVGEWLEEGEERERRERTTRELTQQRPRRACAQFAVHVIKHSRCLGLSFSPLSSTSTSTSTSTRIRASGNQGIRASGQQGQQGHQGITRPPLAPNREQHATPPRVVQLPPDLPVHLPLVQHHHPSQAQALHRPRPVPPFLHSEPPSPGRRRAEAHAQGRRAREVARRVPPALPRPQHLRGFLLLLLLGSRSGSAGWEQLTSPWRRGSECEHEWSGGGSWRGVRPRAAEVRGVDEDRDRQRALTPSLF